MKYMYNKIFYIRFYKIKKINKNKQKKFYHKNKNKNYINIFFFIDLY